VVDSYKRLRRLQDQDIENKLKNRSLSPAQERKYKNLEDKIIAEVKSLRLNPARIDSLVEQLYEINRRLVGYEGRMMRLAESHGVAREDFLKNYFGSELDPRCRRRTPGPRFLKTSRRAAVYRPRHPPSGKVCSTG
jgi:RNA polymerase primary sigma factor